MWNFPWAVIYERNIDMKTLIIKFEYLDDDDLYDAINGLWDSMHDGYGPEYEYEVDDENGEPIVRYRRTCLSEGEEK